MVAIELDVPYTLVPVYDPAALDPAVFHGNPALKLPVLRRGASLVFGTENICRVLAEEAKAPARVVFPEALTSDLSRSAQEMVWHAMTSQVQLVIGTLVNKLPADSPYFTKIRLGYEGALRWLDANLDAALKALPPHRHLSLFEVSLFCQLEHMTFRGPLPVDPYPALVGFAKDYGTRASAQRTAYRFDAPPA